MLIVQNLTVNAWDRSQRLINEPYPITPTVDWFKNGYGSIRWWRIRSAYYANCIDENFVTSLYCEWRDTPEYFMLNGIDINSNVVLSAFVKACKRGNDIYINHINRKFGFIDSLEPKHFFTDDLENKYTPMIFVTLTIATKKYSLVDAWNINSHEFNIFETKLRQKYGKFVKFRVWEAHESGYPHCHVVYYFLDRKFKVWEYFDKDNKRSFRLADKHRKSISNMWSMGNVDIKGVQDTLGAFKEIKKYITKHIWSSKGDKTNAMLSLFNKQSYYVSQFNYRKHISDKIHSGALKTVDDISRYIALNIAKWAKRDFIGAIWGVGTYMHVYRELDEGMAEPAFNALVKQTMCNYNKKFVEIVKWEFVGFILGEYLVPFVKDFDGDWVCMVMDPPIDLMCLVNIQGVY